MKCEVCSVRCARSRVQCAHHSVFLRPWGLFTAIVESCRNSTSGRDSTEVEQEKGKEGEEDVGEEKGEVEGAAAGEGKEGGREEGGREEGGGE